MEKQYIVNGKPVVLTADPSVVAVRFREPAPHSMRAAVAEEHALGPYPNRYEIPDEKFTIIPVTSRPEMMRGGEERLRGTMRALDQASEVARVAPVFQLGPNKVVATDRVLIGFRPAVANPKAILKQRGLEVLEQNDNEFLVRLGEYEDPFDVSEELIQRPEVDYAEPDFVVIGTHTPQPAEGTAPHEDDPLAQRQYALGLTHADEAQELVRGSPETIIAILDEGVDTTHEDLTAAVVGGYDATDDDEYQEPQPQDAHGTACAGLAAAMSRNALGIRGVGAGCSLLAVRIAYSESPSHKHWKTTNSWIRRAIDWSWQKGAAVLSNSWGGGAPSNAVAKAFQRAQTQGRSGKGCVVIIAAGNDSGPVTFPGTLDGVVTVSASNEYDEPKTKSSRDGENWWGSCFGPQVTIAAPGVHNYTTDISGEAGYNKAPGAQGNYHATFNGTSSATPIVAGAAALILTANPKLTGAEVKQILCDTAEKVGSVPYANGRNDYMGFGRLNVLAAVLAANPAVAGAVPSV